MTYKNEFPDYDYEIILPEGYEDISWHNNVCPSIGIYINPVAMVVIWCHYEDPSKRETGEDGSQFLVSIDDDLDIQMQGEFDKFENAVLFANALAEKLKRKLA